MKIKFNKKLDKEVYMDFYNLVFNGADFGKKIRDDHPNINKENYIQYIDDFYKLNKKELEATLKDTELCFNEIKNTLFFELKDYFRKDYSDKDYTCYLSIFNCNPRYLDTKSFQVYFKRSHNMRKEVIAHELTHFAFYDFCYEFDIKDGKILWELSEIFNVIFLNIPAMQKTIGSEEFLFYPDLRDKLEIVKEIWKKEKNPVNFIKKTIEYIKIKNKEIREKSNT